jgi:hypothetical protein
MKLNRREMLSTSLAVSGAALLGSSSHFGVEPFALDELPSPESSGIDHIVVVTMVESQLRSFLRLVPQRRWQTSRPHLRGRQWNRAFHSVALRR